MARKAIAAATSRPGQPNNPKPPPPPPPQLPTPRHPSSAPPPPPTPHQPYPLPSPPTPPPFPSDAADSKDKAQRKMPPARKLRVAKMKPADEEQLYKKLFPNQLLASHGSLIKFCGGVQEMIMLLSLLDSF